MMPAQNKQLRVLVASIPMPHNRFLVDLNGGIAEWCRLRHDCDEFWNMHGHYDVVHIHFPEYLTFAHQDAYRGSLSRELIRETEIRMRYWADRARVVVTRHVLLPHDALADPRWERMYESVYRYADAVVHFAQASIDEFRVRYTATEFYRGQEPVHAVVPHHNYQSLPQDLSRREAREALGIPADANVLLVFGAIRSDAERSLVLDVFRTLDLPKKLLLVSTWREHLPSVSWIRLKYWIRDLRRLYYRVHPRFHFNYGFVEESETQKYLLAADVLFIPRFRVLNSGNVTLGMTFGRVVVGPDSWDVGELLRATGNPVFDPGEPGTAARAVAEGFRLAAEGVRGPGNRELAKRDWSAEACARQYVDLFQDLTGSPLRPHSVSSS